MSERFSHPATSDSEAVPLREHLQDVADRVNTLTETGKTTAAGTSFSRLVSHLARAHDAGKLTTWFQQHIGELDGRPSGPTTHSLFGAYLAHYTLGQVGIQNEDQLAGYIAVARHHGPLPDTGDYVYDRAFKDDYESFRDEVRQQVQNVDQHASDLASSIVEDVTEGQGDWDEFVEEIENGSRFRVVGRHVGDELFADTEPVSHTFYQNVLDVWSTLVLADKTSAAGAPEAGYRATKPSRDILTNHIDSLGDGESNDRTAHLNEYRDRARRDVIESISRVVEADTDVATLTLPTGMGKTLTGLDAAFHLRDELNGDRVIYALPFTSIIDQVADLVQTVFDADATDDLLTVHHHLAETRISVPEVEDDDRYAGIETMLGESWRSGLTITTFVQLFESLAGPQNSQSMKLPALRNSVVVLDEPQALPHDWWPLIRRLATVLGDEYNATLVAMTATKPRLFDEAIELVSSPKTYYEAVERVEYDFDESALAFDDQDAALSYENAASTVLEGTTESTSSLVVSNTIDSAKAFTDAIRASVDATVVGEVYDNLISSDGYPSVDEIAAKVANSSTDLATLHLSTRLRPNDRLRLIEVAKELTERDARLVVVSTQLIEAGVDISFDRVFRDLAPIDSVVQAAGRCNRSYEQTAGTVTVWWLDAPEGRNRTPSEAVYDVWGDSLLSVTQKALDRIGLTDTNRVPESAVSWDAVDEYYQILREERNVGKDEYVSYLDNAEAERLGELSLINDRLAVDVVICRTEDERALVEEIVDAWENREFNAVKERIQKTKPLQVSIPVYTSESKEAEVLDTLDRIHPDTDLRWIDSRRSQFAKYFDAETGFVVPDDTVERRFL